MLQSPLNWPRGALAWLWQVLTKSWSLASRLIFRAVKVTYRRRSVERNDQGEKIESVDFELSFGQEGSAKVTNDTERKHPLLPRRATPTIRLLRLESLPLKDQISSSALAGSKRVREKIVVVHLAEERGHTADTGEEEYEENYALSDC